MRSFFLFIWSWLLKLLRIKPAEADTTEAADPVNGTTVPDPSLPDPTPYERPDVPDPSGYVCYYGCPNSKKAQKLQLGRKLYTK